MNNLSKHFLFIFLFISIFGICSPVEARIKIKEIMYNPDGSDGGREWVRFCNDGSDIDLTGWRFFENETNHKINLINETDNFILVANSCAILIDNFEKFSVDYPDYKGTVFDSAFSLINSSEVIALKDNNLDVVDEVNYLSDWGANGDGNSLQLQGESWVAELPSINIATDIGENITVNDETPQVKNKENSSSTVELEEKIFADAGKDRRVIVGADTTFLGRAFGLVNEPLENARYLWTLGDGGRIEGENILYNYKYPGEYVVVLNVSSGEYTASDRIIVTALPAEIIISSIDRIRKTIELHNRSKYELDLSWWRIFSNGKIFDIPKDTIILPGKKISLPFGVTGLGFDDVSLVYLMYPNGEIVCHYEPNLGNQKVATASVSKNTQNFSNNTSQFVKEKVAEKPINNLPFPKNEIEEKSFQNKNEASMISGIDKNRVILFNRWIFYLFGLILISIIGVLFSRRLSFSETGAEDNEELKPEDFKIIE